jgi:hypothetical protein
MSKEPASQAGFLFGFNVIGSLLDLFFFRPKIVDYFLSICTIKGNIF